MCCCCTAASLSPSCCSEPTTACGGTPRAGSIWRCWVRRSAASARMRSSAAPCSMRASRSCCWRPLPACGCWKCWRCGSAIGCIGRSACGGSSRGRFLWPSLARALPGCSCWTRSSTTPTAATVSSASLTTTPPRSTSASVGFPSAAPSVRRCPGCGPWISMRPFSPSRLWMSCIAKKFCGSWRTGASEFPRCPARWS